MTTPIEMPVPLPVNAKKFDLFQSQLITPVGSGFVQTLERAKPYWLAEYSTPPLRPEREQAMQAFLDQLEGAKNTFIGYDPRRPAPFAYRHLPVGSTPWGSAQVTSGSYANSTLNVSFGASTTLTAGDYLQFTLGQAVLVFRATENKTGTSFALKVKPRPNDFAQALILRLVRAGCEMKLLGKPEWNDSVDSFPSVRFQAFQFVDRAV